MDFKLAYLKGGFTFTILYISKENVLTLYKMELTAT